MWQGNENLCSYGHEMHLNNTNVIVTCILVHVLYIYIYIYTHTHTHTHTHTGCPRRNVPYFGRVFLMLKNTNITQNTYPKLNGYEDNGQRSLKL